jgi:hypothetical protein
LTEGCAGRLRVAEDAAGSLHPEETRAAQAAAIAARERDTTEHDSTLFEGRSLVWLPPRGQAAETLILPVVHGVMAVISITYAM